MFGVWASIDKGATHEVTWTMILNDTNEIQSVSTPQTIGTYNFSYLFNQIGNASFKIVAENHVSNISKTCYALAVDLVRGYIFKPNASSYETTENVAVLIKPNPMFLYPQDMLSVKLYPENLTTSASEINSDLLQQIHPDDIEFSIVFSLQGTYNICTELVSRTESALYCTNVEVWDKLDKLELVETYYATAVNKYINITMKGFPKFNFNYIIWYGDGRYYNGTTNAYTEAFNESNHELSYSEAGMYTITLKAWNKVHAKNLSCAVLVEHPLIGAQMNLYPQTFRVPLPDGWVHFTAVHPEREPLPSNVKCYIDFDEEHSFRTETAFTTMSTLSVSYQFKRTGIKDIQLMCNNSVSKHTLYSSIDVVNISINDFELVYNNNSNMNMTRNPNDPYKADAVPIIVTFHLALLNCSRLPYNLTEIWNFEDGTTMMVRNNTDLTREHQYHTRGMHRITVNFTLNDEEPFIYRTSIKTGSLDVVCKEPIRQFQTQTFVLSLKMFGNAEFRFDNESGTIDLEMSYDISKTVTTGVAYFTYIDYGKYMPKITGKNEWWVEDVYLTAPLIAEFDLISALKLRTDIENDIKTLELPPGRLLFEVHLDPHVNDYPYRPLVSCVLVSGDEIDRSSYTRKENITSNHSLLFDYTYQDLGNQSVNIRCSNFISETILQTNVRTFNDYFNEEGTFDRTYSSPNETMLIYESEAVYISNRMSAKCNMSGMFFWWEILSGNNRLKCYDLQGRRNGTCLFNEDEFNEVGVYRITLNVSIPEVPTYMVEHIYIEIMESEPFAYIEGGMSRVVPVNQIIHPSATLIHAEKSSKLNFLWESER
jgi:hypothetical protein